MRSYVVPSCLTGSYYKLVGVKHFALLKKYSPDACEYFHSFEALINNNALRNLRARRPKRGQMLMLLSNTGELGNLRGPGTHSLIVIGSGYF